MKDKNRIVNKTSRPLHIIMPMAGEGSRFKNNGYQTPKPLIMLHNKPLFMHALDSISEIAVNFKFSFIVRKNHIIENQINDFIKEYIPQANIFSVEKTTRGAVETCLVAESAISHDDSILIMDCDLEFKSKEFNENIRRILSLPTTNVDGGLLVSFESSDSRYSYAEINSKKKVLRTAEKKVISNHALCGAYFFSRSQDFLDASHNLVSGKLVDKEFYTSLLYNQLLEKKQNVKLCILDEYYSYGTPEELEKYL